MKIKFLDRMILFFGALLAAIAGIFLVIIGLQLATTGGGGLALGIRITSIILGLLCLLLGSFLYMLPKRLSYNKHDFVVQQTDNGELRIAVKAIENLVQKCIDVHDEIHVVSMQVNNGRDGVVVELCISLPSNISIPLAVASLQKQIKQYLAASSGIDVREVRVSVETAENEADLPPVLTEEEEIVPAEAAEKKLPLHQRIFGKGEQKVTVPEPPKAEEAAEEITEAIVEDAPAAEATAEVTAEEATEEAIPAPEAENPFPAEEIADEQQAKKEDASNE